MPKEFNCTPLYTVLGGVSGLTMMLHCSISSFVPVGIVSGFALGKVVDYNVNNYESDLMFVSDEESKFQESANSILATLAFLPAVGVLFGATYHLLI